MNAPTPPFPSNPFLGQYFNGWVWNGSMWVQATVGVKVQITAFKASGTYLPSPGLTSLVVECLGGGGAGGSVYLATGSSGIAAGGGGGGAGGYSRIALDAALVAGGVIVTVGAGGVPPAAGQVTQGGTTSFGALCVAYGGYSAQDNTNAAPNFGNGGQGGPAGVGAVALKGSGGMGGSLEATAVGAMFGGMGASGYFGGAMFQQEIGQGQGNIGGSAAPNTGAGGNGAISNGYPTSGTQWNGGSGGSGLCIVTEYTLAGSCPPGGSCAPVPITQNDCLGWGGGWR